MGKIKDFCLGLFKNVIMMNGKIIGTNVKQMSFGNNNTQVIIDGKTILMEGKDIKITVTGDIGSINLGVGKIDIHGSAHDKVTCGPGNVTIMGDMRGDVKTGTGKVTIGGNLDGDVKTGTGNINCKTFDGDFKSGTGKIKIGN